MSDTYGVILENHLSPACGMTARIFQKADILSTGAGLASGAVFLAASFTSIAIAPAVLLTAGGLGVTAGVYALGRSIYTLIDRKRHQESMSFSNSEARGAYLNILAGALGFAGSGATMAVSQLATNGIEIGQGAGAVVNFFGVANIGASGASIVNSGYDVFDQWYNENRKPSLLTIVQLSSSILFFGNALYNFKTCSTIVEETQAKTLQDYQASLRSNRHRKIFNKMMKETIRRNNGNKVQGKAEVISAVRNFPNKDEVFAALTRSNKAMNQKGVKFYASGGDLTMNGQKINTNDFTSMSKKDVGIFLSKLPSKSVISHSDVLMMQRQFSINKLAIPTTDQFSQFAVKMMGAYDGNIQKMIIIAMTKLYTSLSESIRTTLEEVFPDQPYCYNILSLVMEFFLVKASNLGKQYEMWCETGESKFYQPCFADLDGSEAKRYKLLFEKAVKMCYEGIMFTKVAQEELLNYFNSWLTEQVYEFRVETESAQRRRQHNAREPKRIKVNCEKCGGYYYQCVIIPRGK
nr:uncharacterized protein LOC111504792 [Leptinotarsa decemlineata]